MSVRNTSKASNEELEAEALKLARWHMKRRKWCWRFWDRLRDLKYCLDRALREFKECYRDRG